MSNKNHNYSFKYIIVGDSGVGKSCLLLQFTNNRFESMHDITIGVEFGSKTINIKNDEVKLQIWDTAGQESFKSITRSYYRGAVGAIIVFDVTKKESFDHIQSWYTDVLQNCNTPATVILVGNKIDLVENREVSKEDAEDFAKKNNLIYIETSAKTAENIQDIFIKSAHIIYNQIQSGNIDYSLVCEKRHGGRIITPNQRQNDTPTSQCYCI